MGGKASSTSSASTPSGFTRTENRRAMSDRASSRLSELLALLWLTTGVLMLVHIVGQVAGLWGPTTPSYWAALVASVACSSWLTVERFQLKERAVRAVRR